MEKWLANANDILEECSGIGTELETRQKMESINVSIDASHYLSKCGLNNVFPSIASIESFAGRSTFARSRTRCFHQSH